MLTHSLIYPMRERRPRDSWWSLAYRDSALPARLAPKEIWATAGRVLSGAIQEPGSPPRSPPNEKRLISPHSITVIADILFVKGSGVSWNYQICCNRTKSRHGNLPNAGAPRSREALICTAHFSGGSWVWGPTSAPCSGSQIHPPPRLGRNASSLMAHAPLSLHFPYERDLSQSLPWRDCSVSLDLRK